MRSQARLARHGRFGGRVQFIQAVAQLVQGNVDHTVGTRKRQFLYLRQSPHIQHLHACQVRVRIQEIGDPVQLVAGGKSRHVHRIFGRPEGRRVGEVESRQIANRRSQCHRGRDDVDTLIYALGPDRLRSQDASFLPFEEDL